MIAGILLGIVTGLLANELCEFSPWCARKIVRWSAFLRYTDPGRAEVRAEELTAVINDRPGNLFKLITAVCFAAGAVIVSGRRAVTWGPDADLDSTPERQITTPERKITFIYDEQATRDGHAIAAMLTLRDASAAIPAGTTLSWDSATRQWHCAPGPMPATGTPRGG